MSQVILTSVLEILGNLLARSLDQAITNQDIEILTIQLDLFDQDIDKANEHRQSLIYDSVPASEITEEDKEDFARKMIEVADIIEEMLEDYDLGTVKRSSHLQSAGALIGQLKGNLGQNIDNIKALLVEIMERDEWYGLLGDQVSAEYHNALVVRNKIKTSSLALYMSTIKTAFILASVVVPIGKKPSIKSMVMTLLLHRRSKKPIITPQLSSMSELSFFSDDIED